MKSQINAAYWHNGKIVVSRCADKNGYEKRLVIGSDAKSSAVITNLEDGAYVTVFDGKRVLLFKRKLCSEYVDSNLLLFLMEQFSYDNTAIIEWLSTVSEEEFNQNRLVYALL